MPDLHLVRHGESTWNTLRLAQGHNDLAELTSHGLRQAAAAAERFRGHPVRALYASDLRRALQTAAAFSAVLHLPVRADARLRERGLGVFEGSAVPAIGPSVTGLAGGRVIDPDARPAGGESVRDLYLRAASFADELTADPDDAGDDAGDVVVVAHGGTLRVLTAYTSGVPVEEMSWEPLENAHIVRIPNFGTTPRMTARGGI
jgi:2,3-bisphosphoglycerate-dependent phosphoglycerate mutase